MKNLLGLLAKYPEAGKVKTRLAVDIGEEGAARIYRELAERVFKNTTPEHASDFERVIFYSPAGMRARFESWMPGEKLLPQKGRDIGDIMWTALKDLFDSGASKAVITGVDIPDLDAEVVRDAFLALESVEVVIGPADDGGYYLIGMKDLRREIFEGPSWGTGKVFAETVEILKRHGLSYSTVKTLFDIDRIEDIAKML
jgi:rSAM/selenodomain-associated transferase 1